MPQVTFSWLSLQMICNFFYIVFEKNENEKEEPCNTLICILHINVIFPSGNSPICLRCTEPGLQALPYGMKEQE
jgi:hypothetical protein